MYNKLIKECDKRLLSFNSILKDSSYTKPAKRWAKEYIDRLENIKNFLIKRHENTRNV